MHNSKYFIYLYYKKNTKNGTSNNQVSTNKNILQKYFCLHKCSLKTPIKHLLLHLCNFILTI